MGKYLLGDYVKDYRQTHGLSLRDFGKLCGISHTTIDCIEKGYDPRTKKAVNITNNTFFKLSASMGIPVHVLVDLSLGNDELLRIPGGWASRAYLAAKVAEGEATPILKKDKKKPTPKEGDGLSEVSQRFVGLIDRLTPDQQQLLLAQLQAWTEQNEQQAPAAQRSDGEKASESDP